MLVNRTTHTYPMLWRVEASTLGLDEKQDAADLIELMDGKPDTEKRQFIQGVVLADANPIGPSGELKALIEQTISGHYKSIPWPWPHLSALAKALLPKAVTLLCGDPGATKSFFLLEAVTFWIKQGIPTALFELEEDRAFHLNRALAQEAGEANLADTDWARDNETKTWEAFRVHEAIMDRLGRCIWTAESAGIDLDQLAAWVEARAKEGARIIVVDPLTAAGDGNKKPWDAAHDFMWAVKGTATKWQCSIVLVTHPRKGRQQGIISLDDMGGGAAYGRFSSTVLWLEPAKSTLVEVRKDCQNVPVHANRFLHMIKVRNARGSGRLACHFNHNTLRLEEYGVVLTT